MVDGGGVLQYLGDRICGGGAMSARSMNERMDGWRVSRMARVEGAIRSSGFGGGVDVKKRMYLCR